MIFPPQELEWQARILKMLWIDVIRPQYLGTDAERYGGIAAISGLS
jgi:hypothetical protein